MGTGITHHSCLLTNWENSQQNFQRQFQRIFFENSVWQFDHENNRYLEWSNYEFSRYALVPLVMICHSGGGRGMGKLLPYLRINGPPKKISWSLKTCILILDLLSASPQSLGKLLSGFIFKKEVFMETNRWSLRGWRPCTAPGHLG